jgi:hypothetical protein
MKPETQIALKGRHLKTLYLGHNHDLDGTPKVLIQHIQHNVTKHHTLH